MTPSFEAASLFLKEKKQWVSAFAAITASFAFCLWYFQSGPDALAYFQGEQAYFSWKGEKGEWRALKKTLEALPALEDRLSGALAQDLLERKEIDQAAVYAAKALPKLRKKAPFYASFAETSLLIEEGKYQEALERAVSLKEMLLSEPASRELASQNLLRIASLQQKLENGAGEKAAWEEYQNFLGKEQALKDEIQKSFRDGEIDLFSYISERQKAL